MYTKNFWPRVKQLLKKTKTTQKELAEFIGIPQRTMENWIYRGTIPYITEGYRIAMFFNVSVGYLVTGKEEEKQKEIAAIKSLIMQAGEKLKKL